MKTIKEPARNIKVVSEVDICVIGGSCTGVFAAVRAARLGAKVAIVEKQNCFGGTATAGMVNVWHSLLNVSGNQQIIGGLTHEMVERLERLGGCETHSDVNTAYRLDTELLKIELDQLVLENSIEPYLHTMYCAPYMEDDKLSGIIIENKDGRQVILAKFFIDASGDGDLAYDLNLDNYRHEIMQPPTPVYKLIGDISNINIIKLLQDHGNEFGLPDDWGWGGQ
ncbi:MAG: FAD-dependent oxidoreductase, partial [Clostridiales bacterium]|nr:FAD-dependent oxidoreductase [Clostridiales bacterium]